MFVPSTFIHLKKLVSVYDIIPFSICIKPNCITDTNLCVSWLNISEVRGYVHIFSKGWLFSTLSCESYSLSYCFWIVYFMTYL